MSQLPSLDNIILVMRQCFIKSIILAIWTITLIVIASCSPGARIAKNQPIQRDLTIENPAFKTAVANIVKTPWVHGNKVSSLVNGDAFFSAMLDATQSAKKSITFETYAFINGTAAYKFTGAFCEKARQGVKVNVLLDSVGSIYIGEENVQRMKGAGVNVTFYQPYSILNTLRYNTRDHRKLMIIDGEVGFIGGCGVADAWMGDAKNTKQWRENHYQVTGPVVAQIQTAFNDNWVWTGGKKLRGNDYFPPLHPSGNIQAQAFISEPKDNLYTIPHLYRQVIASARKSIIIENSYFIPDNSIMKEILDARKRGVHVEILVPGKHIDAWPVRTLARGYYGKLIRAGVHIYEYQKTMMHCKVLVIDEKFTSVGSANFDPRSLYINDEANLNVFDTHFAKEQIRIIENDKKHSLRITKEPSRWNPLTLPQRICAQVIAPQL